MQVIYRLLQGIKMLLVNNKMAIDQPISETDLLLRFTKLTGRDVLSEPGALLASGVLLCCPLIHPMTKS